MTIKLLTFKDRFALDLSLYIGSWGTHFTLAFGPWSLIIELPPLKEVRK